MNEEIIIPLAGIALPLFLVPTILLLKHRQQRREWRHKERLRALELGLPAPDPEHGPGNAAVVAIGAGVPAVSVLAAWLTAVSVPESAQDYVAIVAVAWGCAWLVSTFALIISLVLGVLLMRARKPAGADPLPTSKPAYDPDAFDVVGSRG